ncbi:hypothetical protein PCASD_19379 [Puccinia coronata f. sp. avenae]|uniref:Zn(2)-C6 fungal-type domain-containing protein n=1 Tax=Puccinia coronata f. sp. avenae TaxID=200324 RepID=A0A2N5SNI6_9BASI|nr:hypothetical protein PCASD_19379 [Puccinia coronata f. sp. avenae]
MNASMTATDQPENVMLPQKFSRDHSDVEDDEVGPVFVKLPDMGWIKVNNFSACDQCRTSHVKCSLSVTGGPCNHCKNRNQICKVYGWAFKPECPAFHIYKPVLPPPAAAPPSPPPFVKREPYRFEWELLVQKLTWLQCEAPRKFRKRCTAMPWKDEQTLEATGDHSRKRSPVQPLECSLNLPHDHSSATSYQKTSHFSLESRNPSFPESLSKKRRISREAKATIFDCVAATEKPVMPSTQHRMSISFILSSIEI